MTEGTNSQTERLAEALEATGLSIRAFSKLLAEVSGNSPESERRNLHRWLTGEGMSDERAPDISQAFARAGASYAPDYFKRPPSEPSNLMALNRRVAELSDEVSALVAELRKLQRNQARILALLERVADDLSGRSQPGSRKGNRQ